MPITPCLRTLIFTVLGYQPEEALRVMDFLLHNYSDSHPNRGIPSRSLEHILTSMLCAVPATILRSAIHPPNPGDRIPAEPCAAQIGLWGLKMLFLISRWNQNPLLHASNSTGQRPMRLVRLRPFTAGEADHWAALPDSIDASTAFARTNNHDPSGPWSDPCQRGREM